MDSMEPDKKKDHKRNFPSKPEPCTHQESPPPLFSKAGTREFFVPIPAAEITMNIL